MKVRSENNYHLLLLHSMLRYFAVPHPTRLRRATFPPGEGFLSIFDSNRQHHIGKVVLVIRRGQDDGA